MAALVAGSTGNSAVSAVAWECSAGWKHVGSSQVAHGVCEVPSMKVLTRGRMNEHSRKSHDDSQLLASPSLLRWPQTPCQARHVCFVTCGGHVKAYINESPASGRFPAKRTCCGSPSGVDVVHCTIAWC